MGGRRHGMAGATASPGSRGRAPLASTAARAAPGCTSGFAPAPSFGSAGSGVGSYGWRPVAWPRPLARRRASPRPAGQPSARRSGGSGGRGSAAAARPAHHESRGEQHDDDADHGAEDPAPVEDVRVADAQAGREMSQPTAAPTRPSTIDASHDFGPLMSSSRSLGTSARPMKPATKPRSSAPITSNSLSRARCFRYAARRQSLLAVRGGGGALRRGSGAGRSTVAPLRAHTCPTWPAPADAGGPALSRRKEGGDALCRAGRRGQRPPPPVGAPYSAAGCGFSPSFSPAWERRSPSARSWGGLLLAAYALADGLGRLHEEGFSGEKEALKRLVGYPLGAAVAGSLVAVAGVVLMYLRERALDRGRGGSRDGARGTNGAR